MRHEPGPDRAPGRVAPASDYGVTPMTGRSIDPNLDGRSNAPDPQEDSR